MKRALATAILLLSLAVNGLAYTTNQFGGLVYAVGSGGEYSTLSAWWTATKTNVLAPWASCLPGADLGIVNITGQAFTPDPNTNYVRIYTTLANRHNGKRDNPGGAYLNFGVGYTIGIQCAVPFTRIEGLSLITKGVGIPAIAISGVSNYVDSCLMVLTNGNDGVYHLKYNANEDIRVQNCIVYGGYRGMVFDFGANTASCTGTVYVYNNTIINQNESSSKGIYFSETSQSGYRCYLNVFSKNNIGIKGPSGTTDFYYNSNMTNGTTTSYNNFSSESTATNKGGVGCLANQT